MFSRQTIGVFAILLVAAGTGFGLAILFRIGTSPTLIDVLEALGIVAAGSFGLPIIIALASRSRSTR